MKGEILAVGGTDLRLDCDVCVIGSGAGGSVLAAGLVERGLSVVLLEEGPWVGKEAFDMQEATAYRNLYQERGLRATEDLAITVLQGRSVGGSTTVNWSTCFRTPERILEHWRKVHGVEGWEPEELRPHFEAVERRLSISEWPVAAANENNRVLLEGCRRLGWEVAPLRRNVRHCANSGYCGMGCPVDAKQAMHLTYLQDALEGGLRLLPEVRAERIEVEGGAVRRVTASALDPKTQQPTGRRIDLRAKVVAVCGGALNSPALLLRSGLDGRGRVGKRTFLHPTIAMVALFDRKIQPYYGAPQAVGSHHFVERGEGKVGFFLETPPVHPMLAATAYPEIGEAQAEFLSRLPHVNALIGLSVDGLLRGDEGGVVSLRRDGRLRIRYPIRKPLRESFRASSVAMARIQLAAGAEEVRSLHKSPRIIRSEADLAALERAPYGALEHAIFSAHQMGGCAMGGDPRHSVVDAKLRYHDLPNLYVVDGSIFPTALGVNPSETIYALAHRAADTVAATV